MKIIAITQARTGSTRFPEKILKKINGESLLEIHLNRIKQASKIDEIIVATTTNDKDDVIEKQFSGQNVFVFRGSEDDVLDRFYFALKERNPTYIVRLTSDCPLIDPKLIDFVVEKAIENNVDYCSNTLLETFPDGQDIEVFTFKALEKAWTEAQKASEREHVTPYIKNNSNFYNKGLFKAINISSEKGNFKDVRMTVDEPLDFKVISMLINELGVYSSWIDYTNCYLNNEKISFLNKEIIRNEGYLKSLKND